MVPRPALVFEALHVEPDLEGFVRAGAPLVDEITFAHRPIPPGALLRIVGGNLDGDPVACRPAHPAVVLVRPDPVVAVPALEDLVVRVALVPLVLAEAVAVQRLRTNGRGERLRLEGFVGLLCVAIPMTSSAASISIFSRKSDITSCCPMLSNPSASSSS